MRNYVIINGVNSLTKNGLAIRDLPPITKTMMRTLREEIDGRDGDIITELGYSAYDKSMTIGLFGTGYDIDDIIAFFNQSGTIVFSNEPDKFYNFKIIDQIDYNKLLKFKEATIRFHCQPFKYPLNEVPLEEEYQYVNGTGTDITLNNTSENIFNKFDLFGNTSQATYSGKNLLGIPDQTFTHYGVQVTIKDGEITLNGTATSNGTYNLTPINTTNLLGTYTLSLNKVSGSVTNDSESRSNFNVRNASSTSFIFSVLLDGTSSNYTFNNSTEVIFGVYVYTGVTYNNFKYKPQLEPGSSATDWQPYVGGIPSPNPEYPQDIHVVSGENTIKIQNKNVLDLSNGISTGTNSGITITKQSDNTYTFIGTASSTTPNIWILGSYGTWFNYSDWESFDKSKIIHTLEPGTYTIKDVAIFCIYEDGTRSNVAPTIGNKSTFTIAKTAHIVAVRAPVMVNGVTYNTIIYPQLEGGSEDTPYEKGVTQSFPINLGNLEMVSIPNTDYKDTFVKIDDVWYKREAVGKFVLDGSESWAKYSGTKRYYLQMEGILAPSSNNEKALIISNRFIVQTANYTSGATTVDAIALQTDAILLVRYVAYNNETLANFKSELSTNNLIVYSPLATPTDIPIEDTTLIEQLEAIKNAVSREGQTNVTQTNNDLPFILDLSALELNSDHLVINNIGNIYAKPTLDLEGTGIVDIYLNDIQMFEVDLTEINEIIINTDEMEAFYPETGALANRLVTGEYDVFKLESGENDLRFSGNLTKATITNYERWL